MGIGGCDFVQYEKVESLLAHKLSIGGKIRDEVLENGLELQANNVSAY